MFDLHSAEFAAASLACCYGAIDAVSEEAWAALSEDKQNMYYDKVRDAYAGFKENPFPRSEANRQVAAP